MLLQTVTGYSNGPKKSTFHCPEEFDLRKRWIYFVNRKDWVPSKYSVICVNHFDDKFINYGKRFTLKWNLLPVPTIQTDEICGSSTLRVPKLPRKKPNLRYLGKGEFEDFQSVDKIINLDSLTEQHSPPGFTFKKIHDSVVYYKLCFDENSGIPIVFESITVNKDLYVSLSYKGYHISLPEWFRSGHNCKLTNCSMLENFPVYIRNKAKDMNSILTELYEIRYYSPEGRPPYSASIIRYALILRHTSAQCYKLLLEQLPLELRFSKYRQMSGGRFLVSLLEVCNSEKILAVRSLLKEDINFWDENIYQTFEYSTLENIMQDIALLSSEILECQLFMIAWKLLFL